MEMLGTTMKYIESGGEFLDVRILSKSLGIAPQKLIAW